MLKTLFAILFALMLLCSCQSEEPETPVIPEEPEQITEPEQTAEPEPENEEVLEENEPEIITEIVDYIPECVRIHAPGLTEKDEPKPEDIIGIGTVEIKKLSGKQKEIIIPLLQ